MTPAGYRAPTGVRIGRNARALYAAEEAARGTVKTAARELGKVLGHAPEQFWTHSLPEALLALLENFDTNAALLAAEAFLRSHGYTVSRPTTTEPMP